jgi:NADH-quinone oxidoreductase subunit H
MNWLAAHGYHLVAILLPIVIPLIIFQLLPLLVVIERRGAAFIQDRVGPNRAALHIQFKSITGIFTGEQGSIIRLRGFGIPYTMTDLVKLLFKENFVPPFAYKSLYWLAPAIPVVTGLLTTALIPWFGPILHQSAGGGETLFGTLINTQMGLLLLFAFGSLTVYGVVLGSWSSNSKFSLLGGMRASAMMISYEVSMGLAALGLLLVYQSFSLTDAVEWQAHRTWGILVQPVGFALFLVSMFAECNRNPFDVAEGESEIIAGFHTEYAGMKFMMYMTGEYLHVIVASALIATLYLGGYQPLPIPGLDSTWEKSNLGIFTAALLVPLVPLLFTAAALVRGRRLHYEKLDAQDRDLRSKEYGFYAALFGGAGAATIVAIGLCLLFLSAKPSGYSMGAPLWPAWVNAVVAAEQFGVIVGKTILVACLFVWVRWTLPRFRYDQIMGLGWKVMLNIALVNLLLTAIEVKLIGVPAMCGINALLMLACFSILYLRLWHPTAAASDDHGKG